MTRRYQVMGIELPEDKEYVQKELANLKKKFRGKCFFVQLGIINDIITFENNTQKCDEFKDDMKIFRLGLQKVLKLDYNLTPACRENMPTASITYDTKKSDEELLKDMNESCRKRTKKAIAGGMEYSLVEKKDYETFFSKRQKTADAK